MVESQGESEYNYDDDVEGDRGTSRKFCLLGLNVCT